MPTIPTRRRFARTAAAAITALAAFAALAAPAAAIDDDSEPPEPPERADLTLTALSVTPVNSSWAINYTVANKGMIAAKATTVAFNGGGLSATRSVPSLVPGASSSGSFQLTRTAECAVRFRATADSTKVVPESNESNNIREATGLLPGCPPRYRITAYSFRADDESSVDWSGSDEPFWTFSSVSEGGTAYSAKTGSFGDVDTGETRYFNNLCIFGCTGLGGLAPLGMGLSIQLWEEDGGNVDQIYYDIASAFGKVGPLLEGIDPWLAKAAPIMSEGIEFVLSWIDNDLLGKLDFAYRAEYLAQALPAAGTSFLDTRVFSNGDATYSLVLVVQRTV